MRKIACALVIILVVMFTGFRIYEPQEYGLENVSLMAPYLNGKFPAKAPVGDAEWGFENAFPNLNIMEPTDMLEVPGSNKFLIAGKRGQIWIVENNSEVNTALILLDIKDSLVFGGDEGLLSIALHPEFANSQSARFGELYVYYTYSPENSYYRPLYNRLSRFKIAPTLDAIDRDSEEVLIQQFDHHQWHNGGSIFFDNDNYLYLSLGDEGDSNDFYENSQKIDKSFFSGLLRIDPDMDLTRSHPVRRRPVAPDDRPAGWPDNIGQHYLIPNDNPWLDEDGTVLEEFFAIGLRSPHRVTYDKATGDIWAADVGQSTREEISVFRKGSNGQWPYKEGSKNGVKPKPDVVHGIETPPVFDYNRNLGQAVIGGFVYRGAKYATLYGKYIFGDYGSGNIWSLDPQNNEVVLMGQIPKTSGRGLVSFSTDSEGYIYIIKLDGHDLGGGIIYRLKELEYSPEPPALLSETGAFSDLTTLTPAEGIIPYEVNTALWSDGADKKRWIALPHGSGKIDFYSNSGWVFPSGTVLIKHFELPFNKEGNGSTRLETRFIVVGENGGVYGVTYKWNKEGTEAFLIDKSADISEDVDYLDSNRVLKSQTWKYPTRSQCLTCHNANAGFVLGVGTAQLNKTITYPTGIADNQIRTWNHLGLFSQYIEEFSINNFPKLYALTDTTASNELKVRSYLESNCSFCHRPGGVEAAFDARITTPLMDQNLIDQIPIGHNSDQENMIVKPKDLDKSELWIRDNSLGNNAMPPLAKNVLDNEYLDVLSKWIMSLDTGVVTSVQEFVISEVEINTSIFPNPFEDAFSIKIALNRRQTNGAVVRIRDEAGRIVYQNFDVPINQEVVIKKDFKSGVYFVETIIGTVRNSKKIVRR